MHQIGLHYFDINYDDLIIPEKNIGIILGYSDGLMPEPVKNIYKEIKNLAGRYCAVKGGLHLFTSNQFNRYDTVVQITDTYLHTGKFIATQLKGSEFVAVFACTIGPKIERWANKYMKAGDGIRGYMADIIGSETVELAADVIQFELAKMMKEEGFLITNRFSPGYCGWPTEDQHLLFSLLPDKFCGITLTASALMMPIKSVSGIIGIGIRAKQMEYPCNLCDMRDCFKRDINRIGMSKNNYQQDIQ